MKIGQITTHFKPIRGGAEVYLAQLNEVFTKAGNNVHVYQPDTGINDSEIVPVKMRFSWLPNMLRFNFSLIPYFGRIAKEDVLVIHYPEHWWPFFWHPRTVVLTHGVNWEFNSRRRQLSRILMAKLAYRFAWRFVANDTNFLRAVGENVKPLEKMFEKVRKSQYFIPNCIDTETFKKTAPPKDLTGGEWLIVPRNFTFPRGVDMAVEAMWDISKVHPNLKMLLVGDALKTQDSIDFKEKLLVKVKELKLEEKVIFYGNHPHEEMPAILSAGRVTIIPTRGSEGTSLSALESMSVGTPVVTTAVAGLQDLPSYQCDPNPQSIAAAVLKVLSQRDRFSREQYQATSEVYNMGNWSKAWLKVIEK